MRQRAHAHNEHACGFEVKPEKEARGGLECLEREDEPTRLGEAKLRMHVAATQQLRVRHPHVAQSRNSTMQKTTPPQM